MNFDFRDQKTQMGLAAMIMILAFMGWFIFWRGNDDVGILTEVTNDPIENIIGRELLASLEKMKNVKLDTALVTEEVFVSLEDYTVEVPRQQSGRRDPFAPIGFDNIPVETKPSR